MKREITSGRIRLPSDRSCDHLASEDENVVQRLHRRIAETEATGVVVRTEWLDGQEPSWLELRGVRTIVLDATQTATDQLEQLDQIIAEIAGGSAEIRMGSSRAA